MPDSALDQQSHEMNTRKVRELFKRLPVRHREFQKNAKAQVGVVQARSTSHGRRTNTHVRCRFARQPTASLQQFVHFSVCCSWRDLCCACATHGQVGATLRLMQAYAVAQPQAAFDRTRCENLLFSWEVRFSVVSEKLRGPGSGRTTLMSTSGEHEDSA